MIGAEELSYISSYKTLSVDKNWLIVILLGGGINQNGQNCLHGA